MPTFRYDTSQQWYKGNTHIHSLASDGGCGFRQLADLYAGAGYHFLFRTDHWVASKVARDPDPYPLLWLDGIELDGTDASGSCFHIVCLGTVPDLHRGLGLVGALAIARQQGALIVVAHPHWCELSADDCARYAPDGVEVYNHVCRWLNGKSDGLVHWTALLKERPNTLAFAVDDAHVRPEHPGWNGGWIMVNAPACTSTALLAAIRQGNFYSTCGPEFHSLTCVGDALEVQTSPVRFARLVGPRWDGRRWGSFDGPLVTSLTVPLPQDWDYAYLEIEDDRGRRAWTNPLCIRP